jgi:hypothetical protein
MLLRTYVLFCIFVPPPANTSTIGGQTGCPVQHDTSTARHGHDEAWHDRARQPVVPCLTVSPCRRPGTGTTPCQTHIVGGHMRANPSPALSPSKVGSEDRHPSASHRCPCHCPAGCRPRPRQSEKPNHCLVTHERKEEE